MWALTALVWPCDARAAQHDASALPPEVLPSPVWVWCCCWAQMTD